MTGASHQPTAGPVEATDRAFEQTSIPAGRILLWVGGLLGLLLFALLFAGGLFALLEYSRHPIGRTGLETTELTPPAPRLETSPQGDRAVIEGQAKARLAGYAWTDRAAGRVRIPIGRAMELVAKRGWQDPPGKAAR